MSGSYKRVNFYDLCRLCAQNIQKCKAKIFEPEGQKIHLQSKIKKCLSINVHEDDFLPKVVCFKCIKQLEVCNAFREECLNSETMLSSYFKNYRHTEDFKKSGKVYIKDTVKPDTTELMAPLNNRIIEVSSLKTIKNEQVSVLPKQTTTFLPKAEMCSKILNNSTAVLTSNQNYPSKKHKILQDSHPNNSGPQLQTMQLPYSIDALNEALKKAVQQLPKEILNKVIVNSNGEVINLSPQDTLSLDSSNIVNGLTSVIKNRASTGGLKKLMRHDRNSLGAMEGSIIKIDLTQDDNSQDNLTNKYGTITYGKNGQANRQPAAQNPTVIFPVPQYQNNNYASVQSNISYPPQTTVNISPSTPTVINVICNNPSESNPPLSSMSQSPPSSINMDDLRATNYIPTTTQQSPITKITAITSEDVNRKKQSSKTDEPSKIHACEVCTKTFKRREHLYQHVKLHTGFRPYTCTTCLKSFVRKEHLLRHMVLHSGERNYACDICNRSFSRHDNLLKHIRIHNKEPAYTCDVCQKVFIIKHYYDAHRNEKVCNISFIKSQSQKEFSSKINRRANRILYGQLFHDGPSDIICK